MISHTIDYKRGAFLGTNSTTDVVMGPGTRFHLRNVRHALRLSVSAYPKQYSRPSCAPITTFPSAMAGEADSAAPASNSQTFAPVAN